MRCAKKIVPSIYLCIRFPFLYPRNRFTGLHYNNWKIRDTLKELVNDAYNFGGKEEGYKMTVKNRWKWIQYNVLKWFHDYFLQVVFCIPTYTELDSMDAGWRKAFGIQMCKEIKQALLDAGGRKLLHRYRISQIKEKWGCYDEKTEVLTKDGFKFFKDVNLNDEIATLNENGELEYNKPTDYFSYVYNGKMYRLKHRGVDIKVTPNHNLYVSKGSYYNGNKNNEKRTYEFELTNPDTYFGKDKRFKKGCIWTGQEPNETFKIPTYSYTNKTKSKKGKIYNRTYNINGPDINIVHFLRFLGFYVAEGCVSHGKGHGSSIHVAYNPYDEEEIVNELIKNIGFVPKQSSIGVKIFSCAPLGVWLKNNCGHLSYNKKCPSFIKNLPPKYIEEFLKYLYIGDGHKAKTSNILTTTSEKLKDDVCELLLKAGYTFRVKEIDRIGKENKYNIISKRKVYEINWLKNTFVEIDNSKVNKVNNFFEGWIDYSGFVYCVTVKNHILYIRRNGKGCWCGNSLQWYDCGAPEEVRKIVAKYEYISERTCISCGRPAKGLSRGYICPYCEDCAGDNELDEYYTEEMPWYGYYIYRSKDEKEAIDSSTNIKEE